ncbi:MAG: DHH family phosphoesterase [Atopobiaceae bacterium]|nr:DHH family phosphoesterase [Atopobiaceae bacterium]MCH4180944.1 DHH family phosphoesterase [Atopobiaceae bacterium]MCH4214026.1 DHH family phosphoesterase [Atopobiaceae bacterium]MCH4229589.1 DHH family phosphoesterase [Atopobiaceae bacterium]MCH4276860.1 DHH family phosphoesterase [Atopobiaceae bacterium]
MNTSDDKLYAWQAARFNELSDLIDEADSIAICAHTNPDGDALGSELALVMLIRERWPGKLVVGLLADDDDVPRLYSFLPGADQLVRASTYGATPDLFICVDLPIPSRMNNGAAVCARARRRALVDHHPCDEAFGDVAIRRPDAAATGVVIAELALHLGIDISSGLADCLLTAIITDTGRFQYQNADAEAFEIASMLVDAGASPSRISLNVYQSFRLAYLHLQSVVMGRILTFDHGLIAYSYATQADLERTGALAEECDGLIDIVRSVEGSKVALFLKETGDGHVRGNLRSKGSFDVSAVARELGGGGHVAAAGFTADGDIDDVLSCVLPKLQSLFDDSGESE